MTVAAAWRLPSATSVSDSAARRSATSVAPTVCFERRFVRAAAMRVLLAAMIRRDRLKLQAVDHVAADRLLRGCVPAPRGPPGTLSHSVRPAGPFWICLAQRAADPLLAVLPDALDAAFACRADQPACYGDFDCVLTVSTSISGAPPKLALASSMTLVAHAMRGQTHNDRRLRVRSMHRRTPQSPKCVMPSP